MNWFRKVPKWVLGIILFGTSISFIFWGIPSGCSFTATPLIEVGSSKIYSQDFQQHYNHYLRERSQQDQRPTQYTAEEGRALGLDYAARDKLIMDLLLEQKARELGLDVSREQAIDVLRHDSRISDAKGNINPQVLQQILQNMDTNEAGLLSQIQNQMLQKQLMGAIMTDVRLPPDMIKALQRFRLERRVAEYVLIDPSRAGQIADPSDADLKAYYEAHIDQFTTPEYRAVTIASTSSKDVAAKMDIPEADIKTAYDRNKALYETPEKRKLEQIQFPNEQKAREARSQIDAGKSFEDVAKAAGFKPDDIQLGDVPVGDKTVPPEAFTLPLNTISQPLKSTFGWVIVRATGTTPGTVKTLDQVHQEIRDAIATERAKDQVSKLSTDYDDARGGGATIEEASKKVNLTLTKIAAIDRTGKGDNGQMVENLPVGGDFLSRVFSAETGGDGSGMQEDNDGVHYEFRVDSVKPAAKKPFDAVRNDVLAMWRTEEQRKRLQKFADDMVKRGNAGASMASLASPLGVAPLKSDPLPRFQPSAVFSQEALKNLFDTKVGGFFSGPVTDGKSYLVARVDSSQQQGEAAGDPQAAMYANILNQAFLGDVVAQFSNGLRRETCGRRTVLESVMGSHLQDCVDEDQFKKLHAGE
jgi:peptidyl-prolyl cis-trans isomerase D